MANKKITDLTALTSADSTDLIPAVDVSAGVTKKVTVAGLVGGFLGLVTNAMLSTTAGELGGAWLTWTPTLTNMSGGTITYAKYTRIGKTIHFKFKYTLAGAGISGEPTFSLPAATTTDYAVGDVIEGRGSFTNVGIDRNTASILWLSTTTVSIRPEGTGSSYGSIFQAGSSTVPFTFGASDTLVATGTYEAA